MNHKGFDKELAVKKFQEYLRIKSVHPDPDYETIIQFLTEYAKELNLKVQHVEVGEECKIIVVMTLPGKNPELPSILLNSHTDVVPVFIENWKCDPWAAIKDENGDIYGRGTQDMKCVTIQYLEAMRIISKLRGESFERTIHLTFVPDEEIGGAKGMGLFVHTDMFKSLNVGFALDEGLASPGNEYSLFYGERSPWWVRVKCNGNPGHGSRFIQNTAAEKLQKVISSFLEFRKSEEEKLNHADSCMFLGDVTTINLTMLKGGVQPNVVPDEFEATFDIRITPTVDLEKFEAMISKWCKEAGEDVTFEFIQKNVDQSLTRADDENPWWRTLLNALKKRGVDVVKEIFSGATDGRFLREQGYQVIGFSPMRNTPILLHDNNEFLNENVFLEGIDVYCDIIPVLANLKF